MIVEQGGVSLEGDVQAQITMRACDQFIHLWVEQRFTTRQADAVGGGANNRQDAQSVFEGQGRHGLGIAACAEILAIAAVQIAARGQIIGDCQRAQQPSLHEQVG